MGTSMALMYILGVKHGFGFSAGLIDYVVNFHLSTKGWLIIPVGLVYAVVYYGIFRFAIRKFNLPTPGREDDGDDEEEVEAPRDKKRVRMIWPFWPVRCWRPSAGRRILKLSMLVLPGSG